MKPLAFVIINYNTLSLTNRLLDNIEDYKSIAKIIVVDNHSTDDSYQQLKKRANKKIEVIEAKENKGFSAGMNLGSKKAIELLGDCDIILSNTDIVIHSDENIKLLQKEGENRKIAVVGPVVCQGRELSRGWRIPTPKQECLINLPLIGKYFLKKYQMYKEEHYKEKVSFVDAVSGCFFLVKSKALEEVGFFDEQVFLYYEENILAKKLQEKNYKEAVCNEVLILHDHSVSVDKNMNYINKFKILKKSQLYFEKHYNYATEREQFFIKFTSRLTLATIYVRVFLKGGWKKK